MKRGPLLIALCSFIAVAAIAAWPVARIAYTLSAGQARARQSFADIRRTAINFVASPAAAAGAPWRAAAEAAWRNQDKLLALVVKDAKGEVLYARPGASTYYRQSAEGLSFERPEGSTTSFSGALSSGLVIEALYVTLSQESLFFPIRDASLALLAVLVALIAWLIVASRKTVGAESSATAEAHAVPPTVPSAGEALRDGWSPTIPDLPAEESSLYAEESSFADAPSPTAGSAEPKAGIVTSSDLPIGVLDGPRGLFDPESGLGWEAYLRERLGSELRRSASFEQDLSFVIASLDGTHRGDQSFNIFASTVRDFFSFKDMAFLFGDGGVALILPNMDVDHVLRMSEELLKKLSHLFKSGSTNAGGHGICMGLTSRAGRLVDADRIIGEAMAAIGKAKADGASPIMAFRPDPEKFRAYLASQ